MKSNNEVQYFDALKEISRYQSVEHLRKYSERDWGLCFEEALEMAYENVVCRARDAIKRKRRPTRGGRPNLKETK